MIISKNIIGIDIGGSKIRAVLFKGGKVLKGIKIPVSLKNREEFLEKLEALVRKLISGAGNKEILGIGCGVAGALDLEKGVILRAPNLRLLNNFNIKNWLEKKFVCDVKIDNDARSFLRAEYMFGAGRGYKNLIGITLGTGIGGGVIINGKMFYGANDSAGELGHMIIDHGKDLEILTVKLARKFKFSKTSIKEFKKNIIIGLANIINILDPEAIIIGGGAAENVKTFLPKIKAAAVKFIISPKSQKNVKIILGKLGENAGAIGAAALFLEQ